MTKRKLSIYVTLLAALVISCGADAKQKALRTTLVGLNTARDGFIAWDDGHQQEIVEHATTFDEGKAQLTEYRAKREKVLLAFEIAYKTLAVAALDPKVENVTAALGAAEELYRLAKTLMDGAPPAGR